MAASPPDSPSKRPPPKRPPPPSPGAALRRLRSRLPVSPLPWHWGRRLRRLAVVAAVAAVIGGAVASVLLQGDDSSPSAGEQLPANLPAPVKRALRGMTAAEKADQVLIAGIAGADGAVKDLRRGELGGVLITADAWPGPGKAKALNAELVAAGSAHGRVPPLIASEQEGGPYRTLAGMPPGQSQLQIGDTGEPAAAEKWAFETARALKGHGFDLNLAPVADVATLDSAIADRAFGDDPEVAAQMTAAAVRGCNRAQLACAVSHFPGLGAASQDTAAGPATVGLDPASLERRDLLPFRAAVSAKAPAVLLSLAFYAAYDPVTAGALSPSIADQLLRKDLGFQGVAITDDLSSGAIAAGEGAPEAAQSALAAGADMVVVSDPADARATRAALAGAVRSGAISSGRLDQAVARVLALKQRLGLLPRDG